MGVQGSALDREALAVKALSVVLPGYCHNFLEVRHLHFAQLDAAVLALELA